MFDENQIVEVTWYSGNKQYYVDAGYTFTKMGDIIKVPFNKVLQKSKIMVKVKCDYCGEEYSTKYCNYQRSLKRGRPCCSKCKKIKVSETLESRYGSKSLGGSEILRDKAKDAMVKKYGVEYALQSESGRNSFKSSMIQKYGADNPSRVEELFAKGRFTAYFNGTTSTSKPEQKVIAMLKELYGKDNCYPGFPVDAINMDCLVDLGEIKIDVEYDGLYWHQKTKEHDRKRNHWLISQGYKVIRILGDDRSHVPTIERLKEEVDYILDGHSLGYIDMNN